MGSSPLPSPLLSAMATTSPMEQPDAELSTVASSREAWRKKVRHASSCLKALEATVELVKPGSLEQTIPEDCFQPHQRARVVDMIFGLSDEYKCSSESAWLSMNVFDRFMASRNSNSLPVLQDWVRGVAGTCFLLSSKYLEVQQPSSVNIAKDIKKSVPVLHQLELIILAEIDWRLHAVTPHSVVNILLDCVLDSSTSEYEQARRVAMDIVDVSTFHDDIINFSPLTIAAAACVIALRKVEAKRHIPIIWRVIEECGLNKGAACLETVSACLALIPPEDSSICDEMKNSFDENFGSLPAASDARAESPSSIIDVQRFNVVEKAEKRMSAGASELLTPETCVSGAKRLHSSTSTSPLHASGKREKL